MQIMVNIPMFEDHFHTLIYATKTNKILFQIEEKQKPKLTGS
jgi:hypothetical protein